MTQEHSSELAGVANLGIGTAETLRKWVRPAEIDADAHHDVSSEESAENSPAQA
jgi:transposase